jgi:hypothetical protein
MAMLRQFANLWNLARRLSRPIRSFVEHTLSADFRKHHQSINSFLKSGQRFFNPNICREIAFWRPLTTFPSRSGSLGGLRFTTAPTGGTKNACVRCWTWERTRRPRVNQAGRRPTPPPSRASPTSQRCCGRSAAAAAWLSVDVIPRAPGNIADISGRHLSIAAAATVSLALE